MGKNFLFQIFGKKSKVLRVREREIEIEEIGGRNILTFSHFLLWR